MLKNTFLHVPRIGYKTEERLWRHGFLSWQDYLDKYNSCPVSSLTPGIIINHLEESIRALACHNARHFEERLHASDAWRFYADFRHTTAFVDIETTGLYSGSDTITVIGLFDGESTKVFVQGKNLEDFGNEVRKYSLLVTFNGKRFDLPFIRSVFGDLPPLQGHIDLLYPLRRLGYRGGLKSIERQIGLEREGSLKKADGYLAVLLWKEYQKGNKAALDTLIRYNLEDVVNLQYLADWVYNEGASRLPIPLERLPVPSKYEVDVPFDEELVEYLSQAIEEQRFNRSY
jgi:uncharacterized protein YprB with RNaseH-like and TPR domain